MSYSRFCWCKNRPMSYSRYKTLFYTKICRTVLYHQQWGMAMGTPMAVSAAIIYLARLEEPLLTSSHLIFYKIYIDDIFFIWSGTLSELDSFLLKLNNLAPTIKLSWDISKERAVFFFLIWSSSRIKMSLRNLSPSLFKSLLIGTCIYLAFN